MNIKDWFKPSNKKNIVVPSENVGPLQGVALIQAFSTEDEPKLADFPKEKYKIYWETYIDAIPGGYAALVRFYERGTGKIVSEYTFSKQSVRELREAVTNVILHIMGDNKR